MVHNYFKFPLLKKKNLKSHTYVPQTITHCICNKWYVQDLVLFLNLTFFLYTVFILTLLFFLYNFFSHFQINKVNKQTKKKSKHTIEEFMIDENQMLNALAN